MSGYNGKLHIFTEQLHAFEFAKDSSSKPQNTLIFIGGLTENLLTTAFIPHLANSLDDNWSLIQVALSSVGKGWATSSLNQDVEELSQLVKYLREKENKKKIVLFGHSTGSQDAVHYSLKKKSEGIDGIILQAPVSDRQLTEFYFKEYKMGDLEQWNKEAKEIFDKQGPNTILPEKFIDVFFNSPITAYRWLSLVTKGGDDDYFSSDLSDDEIQETFGKLNTATCVLYSGADECTVKGTDIPLLLSRWQKATPEQFWSKRSKIVDGATHQLGEETGAGSLEDMLKTANAFLNDL